MTDIVSRPVEPWWAAGAKWLLASFLFPAAVAAYVLVSYGAKMDRADATLQRIVTILDERLPRAGR